MQKQKYIKIINIKEFKLSRTNYERKLSKITLINNVKLIEKRIDDSK